PKGSKELEGPRAALRSRRQALSKGDIRRLARRGGVQRISSLIYESIRAELILYVKQVIHDAVVYTEHSRRTTVTVMDIVYALKRRGVTLKGFG
ncbi:core histone H2A/H2B/H3/H4, partial [Oesophagostomum dentatum]